jgi:hypothetical protein
MSESTLQRIEHDDRPVKRAELLAIAEVCKVPMWFLESGWDGWREAPPPGAVDEEARAALNDIEGQKPRKEVTG